MKTKHNNGKNKLKTEGIEKWEKEMAHKRTYRS